MFTPRKKCICPEKAQKLKMGVNATQHLTYNTWVEGDLVLVSPYCTGYNTLLNEKLGS